ncbi:MAG TPA: UDP-N-acetylmuramoyl-L-alanyl-D-glutamate--2,6-diaminopimelate ligase [Actinomycetales bacterium]|nr:UDP-N-acetylmuramoyl-L-alanyl-D-glutamate--2,6-diaminopimelate ligase [Actinomycetales bacterium]
MTDADFYPRFEPARVLPIELRELVAQFDGQYANKSGALAANEVEANPEIRGIVIDNRVVRAGDIFAALTGAQRHGIEFAPAALAAGAAAVWTDAAGLTKLQREHPEVLARVPVIVSDDPRAQIGPIAARIMSQPADALTLVGITGSNGKTTTAFLVAAALKAHFGAVALRGTVGTLLDDEEIPSQRTTAEGPELQEFFAIMAQRNIPAAALEVSSHAIAQHRIAGAHFGVVGFTNLQRDHLDYHGDMENYFQAKLAFLQPQFTSDAVVCIDDQWGERAARESGVATQTLSTGGQQATWQVRDVTPRRTADGAVDVGAEFVLQGPEESVGVRTHLVGAFNVTNAALAIVLAHRAGVPLRVAADAVGEHPGVPGRMEHVFGRDPGPLALVDYAHAADSVEAAAAAARPLTPGRLILAVGAGGNRDEGKRFLMGQAAARGADIVVVTDDNPRFEDPAAIRSQVRRGAQTVSGVEVLESESRRAAVQLCTDLAGEGDTILFVGKGHETTQEIRGETFHFDDREELRTALARRWS